MHRQYPTRGTRGKGRKPYEYGNKVSIAATAKSNIIVGVVSHPHNLYDSKTLSGVLMRCQNSRGKAVKTGVCDRAVTVARKRLMVRKSFCRPRR